MFCKKCGKEIDESYDYCPYCGEKVDGKPNEEGLSLDDYEIQRDYEDKYRSTPTNNPNDTGSFGWTLLAFCIPLVGLIMWLVWKDSKPITAQKMMKAATLSIVLNMILTMFTMCSVMMQ